MLKHIMRIVTRTLVLTSLLVGGAVQAVAARNGRAPSLLAPAPGTTFLVRPRFMSFDESEFRGGTFNYIGGSRATLKDFGKIRWTRYGSRAFGRGASLTQTCSSLRGRILYCTQHYIILPTTIRAWRVRDGHYTRLQFQSGPAYTRGYVYGLRSIRIKANGTPHGLRALNWCATNFRRRCSHP